MSKEKVFKNFGDELVHRVDIEGEDLFSYSIEDRGLYKSSKIRSKYSQDVVEKILRKNISSINDSLGLTKDYIEFNNYCESIIIK